MLPLLTSLLAVTGVLANAPVIALAGLWSIGPDRPVSAVVAAVLAAAAVALDVAYRSGRESLRWLRPPAVHTQVPQWWGQRYGPWWAAARYGFRLGFGPATILNTWMWWAGVVIVVSRGPLPTLLGVATFVCVRTIVMIGATFGPRDGVAMARRAAQLDRQQPWAFRAGQIAVVAAAGIAIVRRGGT